MVDVVRSSLRIGGGLPSLRESGAIVCTRGNALGQTHAAHIEITGATPCARGASRNAVATDVAPVAAVVERVRRAGVTESARDRGGSRDAGGRGLEASI